MEFQSLINNMTFLIWGAGISIITIVLVVYVFTAIGLMGIAKKQGKKGGWMAWVPVLDAYLLGKLAFENKFMGWILVLLILLSSSFSTTINGVITSTSLLPQPLSSIVGLIYIVMLLVSLFNIYNKMSDKAVLMMIFTILTFGLVTPFMLFAIRNNECRETNSSNANM